MAFRDPENPAVGIGPFWVPDAVRDITALGSGAVLFFIVAATIIFLIAEKREFAALFVFLSVAGGQVVSSLLKLGIDRPRPEIVPHLAEVHTLSFPSGHAMLSAVTYLTLGALLAQNYAEPCGENLFSLPFRAFDLYGRPQSSISRGTLALGCPCRMVRRGYLGDGLLDDCTMGAAPWLDRYSGQLT